jgi:hypothetical protein
VLVRLLLVRLLLVVPLVLVCSCGSLIVKKKISRATKKNMKK